jgi:hypothetical protein
MKNETECNGGSNKFQALKKRRVEGSFDGGKLTSDGGTILLREASLRTGLLGRFSSCFVDYRNALLITHTVEELVSQRVYGLCCGYEDLNDHEALRNDPLFSALVGKEEEVLAGKSTLNRMELTPKDASAGARYKKIVCDGEAVDKFLVDVFLENQPRKVKRLILDLDATDLTLYGNQEGKFYHGYYGDYCYLPLYIFCEDHLLCARLRASNIDASKGSVQELERIIPQIRAKYPNVKIVLRGDSGFARDGIMSWCEENNVDFLFGMAKNERLLREIQEELAEAEKRFLDTGEASRVFKDFQYQTLDSWSCARRVVGKAEHLEKGSNPRFVVTSLSKKSVKAMALYEEWYCKRGDMENRIKEQLSLFADRMSTETMRANQIRLYFSGVAYLLMTHLRRKALKNTVLEKAQLDTIRLKLLKIGARVTLSVRRFYLSFASGYPFQELFRVALQQLAAP